MGQVSKYLRKGVDQFGTAHYLFYCPGCEQMHGYQVGGTSKGPKWTFDGNVERPTFSPSLLCFTTYDEAHKPLPEGQRRTLCHLFVTDGQIIYCGDNPHALNGKTVPLPELPDWASGDKFRDAGEPI